MRLARPRGSGCRASPDRSRWFRDRDDDPEPRQQRVGVEQNAGVIPSAGGLVGADRGPRRMLTTLTGESTHLEGRDDRAKGSAPYSSSYTRSRICEAISSSPASCQYYRVNAPKPYYSSVVIVNSIMATCQGDHPITTKVDEQTRVLIDESADSIGVSRSELLRRLLTLYHQSENGELECPACAKTARIQLDDETSGLRISSEPSTRERADGGTTGASAHDMADGANTDDSASTGDLESRVTELESLLER